MIPVVEGIPRTVRIQQAAPGNLFRVGVPIPGVVLIAIVHHIAVGILDAREMPAVYALGNIAEADRLAAARTQPRSPDAPAEIAVIAFGALLIGDLPPVLSGRRIIAPVNPGKASFPALTVHLQGSALRSTLEDQFLPVESVGVIALVIGNAEACIGFNAAQ